MMTDKLIISKEFSDKERFLIDLSAREIIPEKYIPKLLGGSDNILYLEYLPYEYKFSSKNDVFKFIEILIDIHSEMEYLITESGINLIDINEYKNNSDISKCLGLSNRHLPVKVGDLKPEHIRVDYENKIKICDYETAGLGFFLEDLVWLFYSIDEHSFMHKFDRREVWFEAFLYYVEKRFKVPIDKVTLKLVLYKTYMAMIDSSEDLRKTAWIIE